MTKFEGKFGNLFYKHSTQDDAEDLDLDVEFDGELSEVEEEDEEEEQGDTSKSEGGKAEDSSQKSQRCLF